ncbi:MAG TPA: GNAT family N-acetyltransferase [Gemmatimonadaceae bacterium]|nr:GNAT family N-acetyltransferase [Gemmatimonadaceae bacterium]
MSEVDDPLTPRERQLLAEVAPGTTRVPDVTVRILGAGDAAALERVAPVVFDHDVDARLTAELLADPRHHLAVALDGDTVVGFASAVHYLHPDKAPELWVNELGVAPTHWRRGIARRLLEALFARGRELGCREAWVLTEQWNDAARRLYAAAGGEESPDPVVMVTFRLDPDA